MNLVTSSLKFGAADKATNRDLKKFRAGDKVCLVTQKKDAYGNWQFSSQDLTIKSITGHDNQKVNGLQVIPDYPDSYRVETDNVDLVTFTNGQKRLYGDFHTVSKYSRGISSDSEKNDLNALKEGKPARGTYSSPAEPDEIVTIMSPTNYKKQLENAVNAQIRALSTLAGKIEFFRNMTGK